MVPLEQIFIEKTRMGHDFSSDTTPKNKVVRSGFKFHGEK